MDISTIAFIGLGNMGSGMAANLVKAGFSVRAFDLAPAAMELAKKNGCIAASSPLDAITGADTVITMLTSAAIVESIYLNKDALLDYLPANSLVIDCSTIEPEHSQQLYREASTRNIRFIDAPVSGGTAGAEAGTLSFICGGKVEHVDAAKPILSAMGQNIFHAGASGAGQIAKTCNNMLLAIHMAATAEALQLGVNSGLDASKLSQIMLKSSGCNWSLEKYNPYPGVMPKVPASHRYEGGFMVNLMLKDLAIAMSAAQQSQSTTPLGKHAKQLYDQHSKANIANGKRDFSSIQEYFKR